VKRRAQHALLEILNPAVNDAIHFCEVGIEAVRKAIDKLAQKRLVLALRFVFSPARTPTRHHFSGFFKLR